MRALKRQEIVSSGRRSAQPAMRECFEVTTTMRLLIFLREMRGIGRNEARKAIVLLLLVGVRDRHTKEAVDRRRTERAASETQRRGSGYLSLPLRKEGRTDCARKGYVVDRQGAPPKKGNFFFNWTATREMYVCRLLATKARAGCELSRKGRGEWEKYRIGKLRYRRKRSKRKEERKVF
ncbi:uncharacterized protein EURHEDRAFT_330122 [Aspergillus ruber CBS 135680]|uniref:Uncharacterized protein n=1 Tax=Aspergillus ruber (strain CBS 135680) TaxID=1388766 RepID=A0A017SK55_ASPRC|nr:uncharacterized protein EURHEDRAFT_330122 [Aspergillus ruber CBS 135680]EYE97327.1 hypothetical protein EURHEDRAFT_330122 [Aspergillus ruber CBS 135680]